MAPPNKRRPKTVKPAPKLRLQDPETAEELLKAIRRYKYASIGQVYADRINRVLARVVDPLQNPPEFIQVPFPKAVNDYVFLGKIHGYDASIWKFRSGTVFNWGCRIIHSEAQARKHWVNGKSSVSRTSRPHATALIDYAAAICRYKGWEW